MIFLGANDVAKIAGFLLATALGVNADQCKDLCGLECNRLQECDVTLSEGTCECKLDYGKAGAVIAAAVAVCIACGWCGVKKREESNSVMPQ